MPQINSLSNCLPTTERYIEWPMGGVVETWHSYVPESLFCEYRTWKWQSNQNIINCFAYRPISVKVIFQTHPSPVSPVSSPPNMRRTNEEVNKEWEIKWNHKIPTRTKLMKGLHRARPIFSRRFTGFSANKKSGHRVDPIKKCCSPVRTSLLSVDYGCSEIANPTCTCAFRLLANGYLGAGSTIPEKGEKKRRSLSHMGNQFILK